VDILKAIDYRADRYGKNDIEKQESVAQARASKQEADITQRDDH